MFGSKTKEANDYIFGLGVRVKEKVTGFSGVITGRTQWLTNCNTYIVQPEGLKEDGTPKENHQFDESRLDLIDEKPVMKPKRETGGPTDHIKQTNRF